MGYKRSRATPVCIHVPGWVTEVTYNHSKPTKETRRPPLNKPTKYAAAALLALPLTSAVLAEAAAAALLALALLAAVHAEAAATTLLAQALLSAVLARHGIVKYRVPVPSGTSTRWLVVKINTK